MMDPHEALEIELRERISELEDLVRHWTRRYDEEGLKYLKIEKRRIEEATELRDKLCDLMADQKLAARVELERLLADYLAAADGNMDWYWTDQVENRIAALKLIEAGKTP